MRARILALLAPVVLSIPGAVVSHAAAPSPPFATAVPHADTLHGEIRQDPYRWLRDRDNPDVIRHLEQENAWTSRQLKHTEPLQQRLYDEMLSRIQEDDTTAPVRDGEWWYYQRTEKGKNYPIWCRRHRTLDAPEQIVLDGNAFAEGKPYFKLAASRPSPDHARVAFVVDTTGSEDYGLMIKDLTTGAWLTDVVPHVHFTCEWSADGRVLFYPQHDESWRADRIRRHVLGEDPARDVTIATEPNVVFGLDLSKSRDRRFIVIESSSFTSAEIRLIPADQPLAEPRVVQPRVPDMLYSVDPHGDELFIRTNDQALDFRVARAPIATPGREHWVDLVAHRPEVLIEDAIALRDHLVLETRRDGLQRIEVIRLADGARHEAPFDEPTYALSVGPNLMADTREVRFTFSSPVTPATVIDYDLESHARTVRKRTEVPNFDPTRYATTRVWATAKDGKRIPISLLHTRGVQPGTPRPLMLYGYGAYGISSDPGFNGNILSLVDRGLVYAIAHVRGGQEMGRRWYLDGRLEHKMNTFTDFIAAAEHLVQTKWTSPDRLAIRGGSAGGLLMGASVNLRPDLFRAVVADVPFVDAINSMSDPTMPLTTGEYEQWGNPAHETEYRVMRAYSPYDNLKRARYPAIYATAGLTDPRVGYWEAAKWVARIRTLKTDDRPLLLRVNMGAGHSGASGRYDNLREISIRHAFVLDQVGLGNTAVSATP